MVPGLDGLAEERFPVVHRQVKALGIIQELLELEMRHVVARILVDDREEVSGDVLALRIGIFMANDPNENAGRSSGGIIR